MVATKADFYLFKDLDTYGEGTIGKKGFEKTLKEDLKLNVGDKLYTKYLGSVSETDGTVSLSKVKNGLDRDKQAEELLINVNLDVK